MSMLLCTQEKNAEKHHVYMHRRNAPYACRRLAFLFLSASNHAAAPLSARLAPGFLPRVSPSFLSRPLSVELSGLCARHKATRHHFSSFSPPHSTSPNRALCSYARILGVAVMVARSGCGR
ncbi:hypothetical protein SVAN01_11508 [Stagonosporopsis vannaccii]|nr:hypothetical protein SVAN01_11508 [Stagonosporopsis vannaccii]